MIDHLKETSKKLKAAVKNGSLSQSVLLMGREGIGKFFLVMDIASALLCQDEMSGCGKCAPCNEVRMLHHPDFLLLFPFPNLRPESKKFTAFPFSDPVSSHAKFSEDTKDEIERFKTTKLEDPFAILDFQKKDNIPVEVVKDLIRSLSKKPLRGGRRVAAVVDVDKMAHGAADLFLKTVEEPPANTHIILTTSRPDLLYPTLLSRTHMIKVPPAPPDRLAKHLIKEHKIGKAEASYLANISGGSPGRAINLHKCDISRRRDRIMELFILLLNGGHANLLINEVNLEYSMGRIRFDDIRMDFEIMESLIHDLYIICENRLDNRIINVDIKKMFYDMQCPAMESLDIWKECCAETKRACLVNNVSVGTAMAFFYISCADAIHNPVGPKFKLP